VYAYDAYVYTDGVCVGSVDVYAWTDGPVKPIHTDTLYRFGLCTQTIRLKVHMFRATVCRFESSVWMVRLMHRPSDSQGHAGEKPAGWFCLKRSHIKLSPTATHRTIYAARVPTAPNEIFLNKTAPLPFLEVGCDGPGGG
jgi:hypothetical protein